MLKLTPKILEGAYTYLVETDPFVSWNLPDAEDVIFKIVKDRTLHGWHYFKRLPRKKLQHYIAASTNTVGHSMTLITSLAHEMCHMQEAELGLKPGHGPVFQRLAKHVCKFHGFDPKSF